MAANLATAVATVLVILLIPLSIGIAILRAQLFDIDMRINRTLVYGTLTATLATLYTGSVLGLQAMRETMQFTHGSLWLLPTSSPEAQAQHTEWQPHPKAGTVMNIETKRYHNHTPPVTLE